MKRSKQVTFFVVAILIFAFAYLAFFGLNNWYGEKETVYFKGADSIRWGIDIQGGVEAVFTPDVGEGETDKITEDMMDAAETVINLRLVNENITDYEVYTDSEEKQIIVRFPWQSDEEDYDPAAAVKELGTQALVTFIEGSSYDETKIILQGANDVDSAEAGYDSENDQYIVSLVLTEQGKAKFATATSQLVGETISIWMDETMLSAPTVNEAITDGRAMISGSFTSESATELANQINAGTLPFKLSVDDSSLSIINPSLGEKALEIMILAGIIAFVLICLILIFRYRLPGFIACIALLGQIAFIIACTSGFFSFADSFTLTIPGLTGIILSIGMGVDCNVIANERIIEELRRGKTVDGAVKAGFDNSIAAIVDGNIATMIVAAILMGIFGPSSGFWSKILWIFTTIYNYTIGLIPGFAISNTITGVIYSFGYTLLIGIIANFFFGLIASRVLTKGVTSFKCMRKSWLYGGVK